MPTIKDFEKHHSGPKAPHAAKGKTMDKSEKPAKTTRRRPGRDPVETATDVKATDTNDELLTPAENLTVDSDLAAGTVLPGDQPADESHSKVWEREAGLQGVSGGSDEMNQEILRQNPLPNDPGPHENLHAAEDAPEKIRLDFYGSELLRARVPKAFELAEAVADEWVKDGRFEGLPVGHPLAQVGAQQVLRKAKDLEKKLEEKGVFMLARVGLEYAKSKLGRK